MYKLSVCFFYLFLLLAAVPHSLNSETEKTVRARARDIGIIVGDMQPGTYNAITDVRGVAVGHSTIIEGDSIRTGVTAILPHSDNIFQEKVPAAMYIGNGFGKLTGYSQVEELGNIETPVVLTNTLSVGTAVSATVRYILGLEGNEQIRSVNAVVGETNDGSLNDIRGMHVTEGDVLKAIQDAHGGSVGEGNVGAGTGTRAFGYKGGIGTSSRLVTVSGGNKYTVGVLLQTNFGGSLTINGVPVGRELDKLKRREAEHTGDGSCMIVVGTDAPLSTRNLKRLAKRATLGLARTGSVMSNGSGDYVIAFSTAYRLPYHGGSTHTVPPLVSNRSMTPFFQAVVEATEEAVYNSMFMAETMKGYRGRTAQAIPIDDVINICSNYNALAALPSKNRIVPITKGWAKNSVNAVIFRKDPITTFGTTQYTAFYDENGTLVLAKRTLGSSDWEIRKTRYSGNVKDAHNTISIMVDGGGILHITWDHHGHPLRYCRTVSPGSLELTEKMPMTGLYEEKVTYPEFFALPDGGLLFLYRDGSSGNGITMLNRYDLRTKTWSAVQHPLISGEGERNAYTNQMAVDNDGNYHISWCWRETGDVATNHDICYAKSMDGGKSWLKTTGEAYTLPITADNAEDIRRIPQQSELINHTSMAVDSKGRPYIATYWRPQGTDVPQFHLIYYDGSRWETSQIGHRTSPFTLSGGGSKRIPISRPKILIDRKDRVFVVYRDIERSSRVSVAQSVGAGFGRWKIHDLTTDSAGLWEPGYDTVLWQRDNVLNLFVQKVGQGDAETLEELPPQMVYVLEWKP